jgi:hypothetical protein
MAQRKGTKTDQWSHDYALKLKNSALGIHDFFQSLGRERSGSGLVCGSQKCWSATAEGQAVGRQDLCRQKQTLVLATRPGGKQRAVGGRISLSTSRVSTMRSIRCFKGDLVHGKWGGAVTRSRRCSWCRGFGSTSARLPDRRGPGPE